MMNKSAYLEEPDAGAQQRVRISQKIAGDIESRILGGEYGLGEALPAERELMDIYKASRTTVREAILDLQSRGLVRGTIGARPRIARPDISSMFTPISSAVRLLIKERRGMANLQEARMIFESALARNAARHATPKQIELLAAALRENKMALSKPEAFLETDIQFHLAIIEVLGNPIFTSIHHALADWLAEQRRTGMMVEGAMNAVYEDHKAIFDAIATRDEDAAEAAMQQHLKNVSVYFWSATDAGSAAKPS